MVNLNKLYFATRANTDGQKTSILLLTYAISFQYRIDSGFLPAKSFI